MVYTRCLSIVKQTINLFGVLLAVTPGPQTYRPVVYGGTKRKYRTQHTSEPVRDTKNLSVFCFIPFPIFALFFLSFHRTLIRGHIAQALLPPLRYGSCLAFLSREDLTSFFPRRLASNRAYPRYGRSRQLIRSYFCEEFQNLTTARFEVQDQHELYYKCSIQEGPLDHRGNWLL